MAVIEITEAAPHASYVASKDAHRWSCPYNVTTDSDRDGPKEIVRYMTDQARRGLGSAMVYADEEDPFAFCQSIAPTRKANSLREWSVQLEYASNPSQDPDKPKWLDDNGQPTGDPLAWRGDLRIGEAYVQAPVWKAWNVDPFPHPDATGGVYSRPADTLGPVVNSAGMVLDPPLLNEVTEVILSYASNVDTFKQEYIDECVNHINGSKLRLGLYLAKRFNMEQLQYEAYCIKCTAGEAVFASAVDDGELKEYWRVAYEFRLRQRESETYPFDGWLESVLDRGYSRGLGAGDPDGYGGTVSAGDLKEGEAKATPIRGHDGLPVSEMVLLNGGGQPAEGTFAQRGMYMRWRKHPVTDFSKLAHLIFVP